MFNVFDGKGRGPGKSSGYIQLSWDFRDFAQYFGGTKGMVFLMLMLHSDKEGRSWPSYSTLMRETGFARDTIASAIKDLCEMKIDGYRVLLKYRSQEDGGQYKGSNHYLIWPTPKEIAKWERVKNPSSQNAGINHHRSTAQVVRNSDFTQSEIPTTQSESPTTLVGISDSNYNHLTKSTDCINIRESFEKIRSIKKHKIQIDPDYQDFLDHHKI